MRHGTVEHFPVLPHLADLGEGRAAVLAEDVPDLVVDPLDVPLQVERPVRLEGALVALERLQLLVDALDVRFQPVLERVVNTGYYFGQRHEVNGSYLAFSL